MSYKPISDYGIIGNMLSAALVSRDGSIDWCCLPRFDSPSVFAALLDDDKGGSFQISPGIPFESQQRYLPDTNVLEITFRTGSGVVTLTDFMPCYRDGRRRLIQPLEIHRQVRCTEGDVPMKVLFEPRPNYALDGMELSVSEKSVSGSGENEAMVLCSSLPFTVSSGKAISNFTLRRGQTADLVLCYGTKKPPPGIIKRSADKLEKTKAYWENMVADSVFSSPWHDQIVRSYLTLHLLVYSPSGAIIAAPTTSLPEEIGGERNWDYRYAWLRDASWTLKAFSMLGHKEEAVGFFKWLLDLHNTYGSKIQILYGIEPDSRLEEQTLNHLKGYRGSCPVRVGNAARTQRQLDVFGDVLEAAEQFMAIGGYIGRRDWRVLRSFVNAAADLWMEPDSGIWEVRSGPYHFVHSKFMCWVALDRGIKIAQRLGYKRKVENWRKTAQRIRDDILQKGWNPQRQAFVQHYDTTALDASNLLMPLFDFLPITDDRMMSTFERTLDELSQNNLLHRYRTAETDDGLRGSEGAFLWCPFWVVRNLLRLDRLEEAKILYSQFLSHGNHLGLFSEMVDPVSGEALGNFPQALTHLAIIITGMELTTTIEEKPDL
jgi:GH15 family glucan-1,4-alpha-glucosidase